MKRGNLLKLTLKPLVVSFSAACLMLPNAVYSDQEILLTPRQLVNIQEIHGDDAYFRVLLWQTIMSVNRRTPELVKLRMVNNFFNQIPYKTDQEVWDEKNYWSTPLDLLIKNGGDCEDYVIAKYFTLQALGIPKDKLRLTFVKIKGKSNAHMVLTYYETPSADPYVLDNATDKILYGSERADLIPIYSFNADNLWMLSGDLSKAGDLVKTEARQTAISLWVDLKKRISKQGDVFKD